MSIHTPPSIGIDLGGTKTECLLLAADGSVLLRNRRPSLQSKGYDAMLAVVLEMIGEAATIFRQASLCTVGIGIPGSIDPGTGLVRNANSTCLIDHSLQSDLEQRLGRPVQVRNDADCFTLAECRAGAGRDTAWYSASLWGPGAAAESAWTAWSGRDRTGSPANGDISRSILTGESAIAATAAAWRR